MTKDSASSDQYRGNAAFLYNFIKYASWPGRAFDDDESPIVVAIVGSDPFGKVLDATMKGKHIGDRSLQISRLEGAPDDLSAHVAFTDSSSKIGQDFGRVRFEVNLATSGESELRISSELLKFARIVGKDKAAAS